MGARPQCRFLPGRFRPAVLAAADDPVYGYQTVNVEAQMRNPSSMLHWMRRMLEVRRQHMVFGTGSMEVVSTDNPSVLAYVRTPIEGQPPIDQDGPDSDIAEPPGTSRDVVLCVTNLSRFAQPPSCPSSVAGYDPSRAARPCPVPTYLGPSLFHNAPSVRFLLVRVGRPASRPDWRLTMEQETLVPEELPPLLVNLLGPYLARQRWYAGGEGLLTPCESSNQGAWPRSGALRDGCFGRSLGHKRPIIKS